MGRLAQDFLNSIQDEIAVEGQKLETTLADEVDTRGITNRGPLRQGFESETARVGNTIVLQVTGVRYANYVADGTDPGYWPPSPPIKRWVQTKLNVPPELVPNITFLIRAKIFQEGTPTKSSPQRGRNDYLGGALRRRMPEIAQSIEDAATQALS